MFYHFKHFTVESVTAGHPDKVCDRISDAILDECLKQDPFSRVAVETFGSHGLIVIGGEITTRAQVDAGRAALRVYHGIGYDDKPEISVNITTQSPDIGRGVDTGGAGDQGIMYGYATDETSQFLPAVLVDVHKLAKGLEELRTNEEVPWLKPDGKAQITVKGGHTAIVLVSCQHDMSVSQDEIRRTISEKLVIPTLGGLDDCEILINPTGNFYMGGFAADTGLTGRKIMVDTYGGLIPHGGGCFSGKDATKVDRAAAYMTRFAAKNIVANGLARQCLVAVAYAIGREEPLMLEAVDETGKDLTSAIKSHFDFRPRAIRERLGLRRPIFEKTSAYGHFGRAGLPWEEIINI